MEPHAPAREQFDRNAEKYRDEPLFAEGEDLQRMLRSLPLSGSERVLDLGTGAGHVAIAFAPSVEMCIGVDISERMVLVAQEFARSRGIANAQFRIGSAEDLPFPDASFDIVTCRFTAHHFIDLPAAVAQIARVLKKEGTLIVVDHYAPEEPEPDRFVNDLDRMRDPSHVRESSLSEWRQLLGDNGLRWRLIESWDLPLELSGWMERAGTPPEMRDRVRRHLSAAARTCVDTFRITFDEKGSPRSFALKVALFQGTKLPQDTAQ